MGKPQLSGAKLIFATLDEARDRIGTSDEYTRQLSSYELQAKVQRIGELVERDYLENVRLHARAWSAEEVEYLSAAAQATDERLHELSISLALPDEVWLIKTTGGEEGGANGYTRTNNIFLNEGSLSPSLLRHELFHVVSRHNPHVRDRCYTTIGFERVAPIVYEDENRISNPDALLVEHAIAIRHRQQVKRATIVLTGTRPYQGGSFFSYVAKRLLLIDEPEVFLDFGQAAGLYEKIGRNTSYNIHAEEVCASHFELMMSGRRGLPQPDLIDGLRSALSCSEGEAE